MPIVNRVLRQREIWVDTLQIIITMASAVTMKRKHYGIEESLKIIEEVKYRV
jgi:hypothetical protein